MPLNKSGTKKAFKSNLKKELASGKGMKQALAIAFSANEKKKKKGKKK